jgi:hypothetical protein
VGSNLANGLFHFNGSLSQFGFAFFAHGLGMGKGMGSNHHPFCIFFLEFHLPFLLFLLFLLFFGLSWIRKEAMEIFNNFFTTKKQNLGKKPFGNLLV